MNRGCQDSRSKRRLQVTSRRTVTKSGPRSEREIIEAALAECRGRISGRSGAAAKLGVPPSTLENRIKALAIKKTQFKFSLTHRQIRQIHDIRKIHHNPHIRHSAVDCQIVRTVSDLRMARCLLFMSLNHGPCEADVTCRIDRVSTNQGLVLQISGRITGEDLDVVRTALNDRSVVAVELTELALIERDALKLLAVYEASGIELP